MQYRRALGLVALLGACGGGGSSNLTGMDAGPSDGAADAPTDAAPDAPDAMLDPLADNDGDGILNGVDVCPTVADPAQVDLDGDGIGWMCDPIESTTLPYSDQLGGAPMAARGNTIGILLEYACANGTCRDWSLSVGPGGISRDDEQADPWLNSIAQRGFVAGENHVLWSLGDGVLGDQDASTDTFTSRHTGGILGFAGDGVARYERDQLLVLSSEPRDSTVDSYDLLAPKPDGSVTTVATSTAAFLGPTIVGHNPAHLVFGVSDATQHALLEFVPGSSASQPISVGGVPLSSADLVVPITLHREVFGYCVDQGGVRYIVETYADQIHGYVAPISSCSALFQQTLDHQLAVVSTADSSFAVINGAVHPLAVTDFVDLTGDGLPAVITKHYPPTTEVDVLDATGALHPVASDGLASNVARQGGTLHFLSSQAGTLSLVRYRNGTVTSVPLPAIGGTEQWSVFTTAEGAALVSTSARAMVWPSQAATATQIDFDHMDVLVRGGATFFVASHNAVNSQPALYSYVESGGVPLYTALTPEVVQNVALTMQLFPVVYELQSERDELPATDWFVYSGSSGCRLVYPMVSGTTVTLLGNIPCAGGATIRGFTPAGAPVLDVYSSATPEELYTINGSSITKVAEARNLKFYYAGPQSSVVLGWSGQDVGGNQFLCSSSHPGRCWTPPTMFPEVWGPIDTAQPDGLSVLYDAVPLQGMMTFTSLRTIGPGNRPQPL